MVRLTIGMAHHTDFDGVYFTVTHILQTVSRIDSVELLVVDSSSGNNNRLSEAHLNDLRNFLSNCSRAFGGGAKLVELRQDEVFGTTQPRQAIFDFASGDYVLVLDCHVLVIPKAIDYLIEHADDVGDNLISGPILDDAGRIMATHFDDVWRDEMWGIWAVDDRLKLRCNNFPVAGLFDCLVGLAAFEIPAMGLGLFVAKRSSWLGFNRSFRGFGGEEFYIHEKYRKNGRKCICFPWLCWSHRFGRPAGISYPITKELKVRNYILGHKELGIPIDRLYKHFVSDGRMSEQTWKNLLSTAEHIVPAPAIPTIIRRQGELVGQPNLALQSAMSTIDDIFVYCQNRQRDLNQHMITLKEWGAKCEHITDVSSRVESAVAFIAARPRKVVSYNIDDDVLLAPNGAVHSAVKNATDFSMTFVHHRFLPSDNTELEDTDLLFLDAPPHNRENTNKLLKLFAGKVRRAIIFHDTLLYGERGEAGEGILESLHLFLRENRNWKVAYHTDMQYGLTVLSCNESDFPHGGIHLPGDGPGTELKKILAGIGITASESCDCNAKARQMDVWGVDGCNENFDVIVNWLREGADRWGWKSKLSAGFSLLMKDPLLAIKINPIDPYPALVREAIRRASSL